jgi:hypothetical protein
MRHRSAKSIGFLVLLAAAAAAQNSRVFRLHDNWLLQSSSTAKEPGATLSSRDFQPAGWYKASVPTTVLSALVDNKVYPDPYFGLNLKSVVGYREGRWLAMPPGSPFRSSWWFRREFTLPAGVLGCAYAAPSELARPVVGRAAWPHKPTYVLIGETAVGVGFEGDH